MVEGDTIEEAIADAEATKAVYLRYLEETLNRIVQISATNIKNYCEGKKIINRVNLEE